MEKINFINNNEYNSGNVKTNALLVFKRHKYKFIDDTTINRSYKIPENHNNEYFSTIGFKKYEIQQEYKFIDDILINVTYKRLKYHRNKYFPAIAFQKYKSLCKINKNLSLEFLYLLEEEEQILNLEMKEKLARMLFEQNEFLRSAYLWFELYIKLKKEIFLKYLIASTLKTNLFNFFLKI